MLHSVARSDALVGARARIHYRVLAQDARHNLRSSLPSMQSKSAAPLHSMSAESGGVKSHRKFRAFCRAPVCHNRRFPFKTDRKINRAFLSRPRRSQRSRPTRGAPPSGPAALCSCVRAIGCGRCVKPDRVGPIWRRATRCRAPGWYVRGTSIFALQQEEQAEIAR